MSEPENGSVEQALIEGVALVRAGRYGDAIPLLERVDRSGRSPHARMILGFARFRLEGHRIASVACHGRTLRFEIGGDNLGLDMFHVSGQLFEAAELDYCRARVPQGSHIVDIGANTGNHSVFFGSLMAPASLLPIEPNADAVARLRTNLDLNGIGYDPRGLGIGVGVVRGAAGLSRGVGDLVVGRLTRDGPIPVMPLDELVDGGPVDFMKVDVEGMEFSVLAGAQAVIRTCRPLLLVETADRMEARLLEFCEEHRYRIERRFPGHNYTNYFLGPM